MKALLSVAGLGKRGRMAYTDILLFLIVKQDLLQPVWTLYA